MLEGGRRAARAVTVMGMVALVLGAGVVVGAAVATVCGMQQKLVETRTRLAWATQKVGRQHRALVRLASEVDRVTRTVADARDRMVTATPVVGAPQASPAPVAAAAGGAPERRATEGEATSRSGRAIDQLAWLEADALALDASVNALHAATVAARPADERAADVPSRWPVRGDITSGFGVRDDGERTEFHAGVDIGAAAGTPVIAAASGDVVFAGAIRGYGNVVVLSHGHEVQTLYAHLSRIGTAVGRRVEAGETIGAVGRSGRATGTHLHYEVRMAGAPVDPACHLGGALGGAAAAPLPTLTTRG